MRISLGRIGAAVVAVGAVAFMGTPAYAASSGSYAQWVVSGGSGNWQGAGTPAAGFPMATVASNATSVQVPSGATTFLGPNTPIGAEYGSSQAQNYMNVSTAAGFSPSTTTITFAKPTPAGKWAFALGDVDADLVAIAANDANGDPVTAMALGFQSTFNYCAVSPKPGSCLGPGPFLDVPTWDPDTSTLSGSGLDTFGAAAWFQPTVAIKSITFTFARKIGSPVFQLWLATKSVPVETIISGVVDRCEPRLELIDADGQTILDANGQPVVAKADADGHARFAAVADGKYTVKLITPNCGQPDGPVEVPITVDTETGQPVTIPPGTFSITVSALPDTGTPLVPVLSTGLGLVLFGAGLLRIAGRRRGARPELTSAR